jgi:hypothetical protein
MCGMKGYFKKEILVARRVAKRGCLAQFLVVPTRFLSSAFEGKKGVKKPISTEPNLYKMRVVFKWFQKFSKKTKKHGLSTKVVKKCRKQWILSLIGLVLIRLVYKVPDKCLRARLAKRTFL